MEIHLTEETLEYCKKLATERNNIKEANNVTNHKIDKAQSDWEMHYLGLRGEAVIATICGQPLDDRILLKGDGGVLDFTTPNGHTVQCKARKDFKNRDDIYLFFNHLSLKSQDSSGRGGYCTCHNKWVRNAEIFQADYAYLVVSDEHDEALMTVLGSIKKSKFLKEHIVKNFNYGPRYAVSHKVLTPVPQDFEQRLLSYKT